MTRVPAVPKRAFVLPFFGANALAGAHAAVRLGLAVAGDGEDGAAWALALGTHATVLAFSSRSWPHRDSGLAGLLGGTALGTAALAALLPGSAAALVPAAVVGAAGSALYARWYVPYGRTPSVPLAAGEVMPDVRLRRLDGADFWTRELAGAPAAVFFFRGSWCPFCSAQVKAVVAGYDELARRGVRVAMVSPQPEAESRGLAERFGVDVLWLRDPDLSAARALGLLDAGGVPVGVRGMGVDTVLPTLVVLDAEGRIVGTHETDDYRVRPDASTVLALLDGVGATAAV